MLWQGWTKSSIITKMKITYLILPSTFHFRLQHLFLRTLKGCKNNLISKERYSTTAVDALESILHIRYNSHTIEWISWSGVLLSHLERTCKWSKETLRSATLTSFTIKVHFTITLLTIVKSCNCYAICTRTRKTRKS